MARLPGGSTRVRVSGTSYYRHGHAYYRPYFYGGVAYYEEVRPPWGVFVAALPAIYTTRVIDNSTYYYSDGVYYTESEQDDKEGYVVAEPPDQASATDPYEILRRMSDQLGQLEKFHIVVSDTVEEVLASGEKVQLSGRREINVSRPDKVLADVNGDNIDNRLDYNGNTITMLDRTQNLYSVVEAPETIEGMLDFAAKRFGITVPLADLLYRDVRATLASDTQTGQYVGLHMVGKYKCHHLAFTQESIDWEIWIQAGDQPLPRKFVITYKQQTGNPRYLALLVRWDLSPSLPGSFFDFKAPAGAEQIEALPVATDEHSEAPTGVSYREYGCKKTDLRATEL